MKQKMPSPRQSLARIAAGFLAALLLVQSPIAASAAQGNWLNFGNPNSRTSATPAAAAYADGTIMQVWRDANSDQIIWSLNGGSFQPLIGALSHVAPSIVMFRNTAHVFWAGTDNRIYHDFFDGSAWQFVESIPGNMTTTHTPVATPSTNNVDSDVIAVAFTGLDQTVHMVFFVGNGGFWLEVADVPGSGTPDAPALAGMGRDMLVVWRGFDNHLYNRLVTLGSNSYAMGPGGNNQFEVFPGGGTTQGRPVLASNFNSSTGNDDVDLAIIAGDLSETLWWTQGFHNGGGGLAWRSEGWQEVTGGFVAASTPYVFPWGQNTWLLAEGIAFFEIDGKVLSQVPDVTLQAQIPIPTPSQPICCLAAQ